jgi:hypothetical protein
LPKSGHLKKLRLLFLPHVPRTNHLSADSESVQHPALLAIKKSPAVFSAIVFLHALTITLKRQKQAVKIRKAS